VDERDVLRAWRDLFRGQEITPQALAKADSLLDGLSGESPLHIRLATELSELKKLPAAQPAKRTTKPRSK
jgi:hypothetical protein